MRNLNKKEIKSISGGLVLSVFLIEAYAWFTDSEVIYKSE